MAAAAMLLAAALVALGSGHGGQAFDPNPLQDFCVADATSKVRMNGLSCKDPTTVVSDDFFFTEADMPGGITSKRYGFSVLTMQIPGLNTQAQSHARVDLAPGAVFPPHYHPRASETALVLDGSVYFGFVSSYPNNKLSSKVLHKGDVFSVPQGLLHFLHNNDTAPATLYASLSSQNPGWCSLPMRSLLGTPRRTPRQDVSHGQAHRGQHPGKLSTALMIVSIFVYFPVFAWSLQ